MSKREIIPEREKKRNDFQSRNAPGSNPVPTEDKPEEDITPEFEGESLTTDGETYDKLTKPSRDSLVKSKRKPKNQ